MVNALFNLKTQIFPPFLDTILTVLDPNPYSQYGSGSRGAISIRIHMDPDPKHWLKVSRFCCRVMYGKNVAPFSTPTLFLYICTTGVCTARRFIMQMHVERIVFTVTSITKFCYMTFWHLCVLCEDAEAGCQNFEAHREYVSKCHNGLNFISITFLSNKRSLAVELKRLWAKRLDTNQ